MRPIGVAQREVGAVYFDRRAGTQVDQPQFAFPHPLVAGGGNDGLAVQGERIRHDIVSAAQIADIGRLVQADHPPPGGVHVGHPPVQRGGGDEGIGALDDL